jgi:hypothetical protein
MSTRFWADKRIPAPQIVVKPLAYSLGYMLKAFGAVRMTCATLGPPS